MACWWERLRRARSGSGPLGLAVTGLPTVPLSWVDPAPPERCAEPLAAEPLALEPLASERRVVLGFLDGSSLELDLDSAPARKLADIAASMVRKD